LKILQTTLPNGLRIITAHMPGARSLTAQIFIGTGSRQEDFRVNGGVAHFLEHLLFKGTEKYPTAQEISEAVDAVGGYNNAYTSEELTTYIIKVPAKHGELALDILAEMMTKPLLDADEIERERGVIIEEMNVYRDDPARFVGTMMPELIFAGNPLGRDIIGTEEVIKTVPREEIERFFRSHYVANNMVVAVAGKVDHESVVAQAEALLGTLESHKQPELIGVPEGPANDLAIVQQKETAQAHFLISSRGYSYTDPKVAAARLVTAVLGRGMSSRLFVNVRERQGLAYTVYADHASFVDTGIFSVYAGVNLDKLDQAITSVLHELKRIVEEPISDSEFKKAKQQLCAGMEMSQESNSNVADAIGTQVVLLGEYKSIEERIEELEAVTIEQMQAVAAEMLAVNGLRFALIAPDPEPAAKHFEAEVSCKS
jgi:predicted Zn-dependent peptidase